MTGPVRARPRSRRAETSDLHTVLGLRFWSGPLAVATKILLYAMIVLVFLGFGWVFAVRGFTRSPPFVRRLARVVPWYLAAFAIWGWWREARILTSLYPVLVPLVLSYCYTARSNEDDDSDTAARPTRAICPPRICSAKKGMAS